MTIPPPFFLPLFFLKKNYRLEGPERPVYIYVCVSFPLEKMIKLDRKYQELQYQRNLSQRLSYFNSEVEAAQAGASSGLGNDDESDGVQDEAFEDAIEDSQSEVNVETSTSTKYYSKSVLSDSVMGMRERIWNFYMFYLKKNRHLFERGRVCRSGSF